MQGLKIEPLRKSSANRVLNAFFLFDLELYFFREARASGILPMSVIKHNTPTLLAKKAKKIDEIQSFLTKSAGKENIFS